MNRLISGIVLSLALAGCTSSSGLSDALHPTGSSTLARASDGEAVYAVNIEAGTVSRFAPGTSTAIDEVEVGLEPTRIARAGKRVFVTLRAERAMVVLDETSAGLQVTDRVEVGAEPYAVVANESGSRVYVAASQADRVHEIDASSLEILRTWIVRDEPRYLALHPSNGTLFVGSGRGAGTITQIPLNGDAPEADSGEVAGEPVALPVVFRFDQNFVEVELTGRITGDMAISPNGEEVVVPVVYVDNVTPVGSPEGEEASVPVADGYGSVTEGIGRFNPAVVVIPVGNDGAPSGDAEPVFISGNRFTDIESGELIRVRSYPSSVTVSPDNALYMVTMQGSDTVVAVGALPFEPDREMFGEPMVDVGMSEPGMGAPFTSAVEGGFSERPKSLIPTGDMFAPNGMVFLDDGTPWIHSTFDRTVAGLVYDDLLDSVRNNGLSGFDDVTVQTTRDLSPVLGGVGDMTPEIERGRKLFFSSTNQSMVASGSGVSCGSCHFEGRNDGLTWAFTSGDRQTPSLAGPVSLTAPVTWTSDVPSVAAEAQITTEIRMGGHSPDFNPGVATPDYDAIAAYVEWTRHVDVPDRGASTDAISRGRAIFERADVACASCHNGEAFTDNRHHTMFGLNGVNTPTLVGIAASGPYLHDGRASDLREVLEWSRSGEMGDTSMLSEAEMSDLEAYLRSL